MNDQSKALAGRLALVTGAGTGIGTEVAVELASLGADVVLHYAHSESGARGAADRIASGGRRATALRADLGDARECGRLVDEASEFLGGLDLLVNNSGVTARVDFDSATPELFDQIFAINVRSHYFCAQRSVGWMDRRGGGSIVNLSSIHSYGSLASYSIYSATKGAVNAMTRVLAMELAPRHIRVNAVAPGHVEVQRHLAMPDYDSDTMTRFIPVGRVGHPEDIAKMVAYLSSDAASYITGQVIFVDGGASAGIVLRPPKLSD